MPKTVSALYCSVKNNGKTQGLGQPFCSAPKCVGQGCLSLTRVVGAGGAEAEDPLLGGFFSLVSGPSLLPGLSVCLSLSLSLHAAGHPPGPLQHWGGGRGVSGSPIHLLFLEGVFLVTQVAVARPLSSALGRVTTALLHSARSTSPKASAGSRGVRAHLLAGWGGAVHGGGSGWGAACSVHPTCIRCWEISLSLTCKMRMISQDPRMSENRWSLSFSAWLTSLSIIPSSSIHVAANGRISFFLIAK